MATEIGALSHLVEAATALANLDSDKQGANPAAPAPNTQPTQQPPQPAAANQQVPVQHQPPVEVAAAAAAAAVVVPAPAPPVVQVPLQRSKREIFPQRLLAVLNEPSLSGVISWLPHGRSFVIIRPDVFTEKVMPKYFPPVDARGSTKYPSFTRKLNRWGFRQATRGPDTGAFHHPLFQRDHPELCVDMVCQRSRSTPAKNQAKKQAAQQAAIQKAKAAQQQQQLQQQQQQQQQQAADVQVAPLTKEAIDRILPSPAPTVPGRTATTVSLDETRSVTSNNSSASNPAAGQQQAAAPSSAAGMPNVIKQGISTDRAFVDMAVRQRDEMERMRVAQALLYKAFTSAVQEQGHHAQVPVPPQPHQQHPPHQE